MKLSRVAFIILAPCCMKILSRCPSLNFEPRIMKFSAALPQYSPNQALFASKPPAATINDLAVNFDFEPAELT